MKEQRRNKLKVSVRLISLEAEKSFNADADECRFKDLFKMTLHFPHRTFYHIL